MRNRKVLLGLTCLAASTVPLSTAHADRRTGLSGNLLIQDADDLFPFPQLTLKHRNMLRLDYGPGAGPNAAVGSSGNGVMTLGDESSAYGLAVHRGDLLSPDQVGQSQELVWLGGVGNPFGGTSYGTFAGSPAGTPVLPATVFDLFYARAMGDNALGARLGFGRGIQSTTVGGDTAKGAQTFLAAQVGYSMLPPEGLRLDLSGNLVFAYGKSTVRDPAGAEQDANSGTDIRLGLLGRGYLPINPVLDVGFLANLAFNREGTEQDTPKSSSNDLSVDLMAGVGPSINLERAKIAAYAGVKVGYGSFEPDSETRDDETSRIPVAAPVVNMAAEVQLLDWLYVRTGAQYEWRLTRTGGKAPVTGDDVSAKSTAGVFGWTSGIGMQKDNFSFDGALTNGFVTGGPNFIGGTSPGFLAMASATYRFGEVLSGEGAPAAEETGEAAPVEAAPVAPEPAAEPAEEPAAEPAAEPAQETEAPAVEGTTTGEAAGTDTSVSAGGSVGVGIAKP